MPNDVSNGMSFASRYTSNTRTDGTVDDSAPRDVALEPHRQRVWLEEMLARGTLAHRARGVRLRGMIDAERLASSVSDAVRHHEEFCRVVRVVEDVPVSVECKARPSLVTVDAGVAGGDGAGLTDVFLSIARRSFDLESTPGIRIELVRFASDDHMLVVVMHPIVSGSRSADDVLGEILRRYAAESLATTYAGSANHARAKPPPHRAVFPASLEGATSTLDFPGRSLRARGYASVREETRHFSSAAVEALGTWSRSEAFPLESALLAAFAIVVQRYARDDDFLIETDVDSLRSASPADSIGASDDPFPVRFRLAGDPSFAELTEQIRSAAFERLEDPQLAFHGMLIPPRNVVFSSRSEPALLPTIGGLDVTAIEAFVPPSHAELAVDVSMRGGELICSIAFDRGVFDDAAIGRMLDAYEVVLIDGLAHAERPISALRAVDDAERRRRDGSWNDTARPLPGLRVHEHFERRARLTPDAVAVIDETQSLTYAAVNERANRIARALLSRGVERGSRVGVCLERSVAMVPAFLAILKAGAAYVPLDPDYPSHRIAKMCENAEPLLVVTERRSRHALREIAAPLLSLDEQQSEIESFAEPNVDIGGGSHDLAYVMYTSGSTGDPKGVCISHRAVERLAIGQDYTDFTEGRTIAQASTITFDAATYEVWGTLLNGSRLAIVPKRTVLDPEALERFIDAYDVDVLALTTSLFHELARAAPGMFGALDYLVIGGEQIDARAAGAVLQSNAPPNHLVNTYGPTEATTDATSYLIVDPPPVEETVPIGRPIANTTAYLLDRWRNAVPVGAPGELYLGGPGLALGYLGDEALTQARFVPNPFVASETLYATGDLGRLTETGDITLIGRIDGQIKLRGFRIEPGDIETVVRGVPGVGDVRVVAVGELVAKRLVAYVVPDRDVQIDSSRLLAYARERLPAYMVPKVVVVLPVLPLKPNGKLDREALPLPARDATTNAADADDGYELELRIRSIVETLLDTRPVGLHDDFFALGGHSLAAVRLIAEIEDAFGKRISFASFYENATVAHLAELLLGDPRRPNASPMVAVNEQGSRPPFFFFHGSLTGGGYYAFDMARRLGADQPVYLIRPPGIEGSALPDSVEKMSADALDAILAARPHGPYRIGGYCNGGVVAFETARLLEARGEHVSHTILLETPGVLPLVRRIAGWLDRFTHHVLHVDEGRRRTVVGGVARLACHVERFSEAPSKRRFARDIVARFARRLRRRAFARPNDADVAAIEAASDRIVEAYVPRRLRCRVTVLVAEGSPDRGRPMLRGWPGGGTRNDVRVVPGDHHGCITDHLRDTAAIVAGSLAEDPPD